MVSSTSLSSKGCSVSTEVFFSLTSTDRKTKDKMQINSWFKMLESTEHQKDAKKKLHEKEKIY